MSIDDESANNLNNFNENNHINHEEIKRLSNTPTPPSAIIENENDEGDIALEEGEIDDDNNNEKMKTNDSKKSHKRKRRDKKSRKRRKETVVYDEDLYAYDIESPDKKQKNEPQKPQIQSLLSLNLMRNDGNTMIQQQQHQHKISSTESSNDDGDDRINQNEQTTLFKSLHDLIPNIGTQFFLDPTITEKENSKPLQQQQQAKQKQETDKVKKLTKKQRKEAGIVSKKEQKKIKYIEMMKQREKQQQQPKLNEKAICKFYLEGRCTKGDECPFSHNAPINKKFEICKYYLNGYCSKNENCIFMHAEFPCKFFQIRHECKNGANCKFSHLPITSTEMREAFIKYLKETDEPAAIAYQATSSLLGSPPRSDTSKSQQPVRSTNIPSLLSLPSLMNIQTVQSKKPPPPSLMSAVIDVKPKQQQDLPLFSEQDIDYRCSVPAPVAVASDVDFRTMFGSSQFNGSQQPDVVSQLLPDLMKIAATTTTPVPSLSSLFNQIKAEPVFLDAFKPDSTECVEIDARTDGTLPYRAILIDIPPSPLWKNPPNGDSESDPRIQFYSNRLNMKNNQIDNENKQQPPVNLNVFTASSTVSALSPPQQQQQQQSFDDFKKQKPSVASIKKDPRLASKTTVEAPSLNDLLSLQNQILSNPQQNINQKPLNTNANRSKLSIDDYKRKTQTTSSSSNSYYNRNEPPPKQQQQQQQPPPPPLMSSYAPPSYSVSNLTSLDDLKLPQSLHELLKNFPS